MLCVHYVCINEIVYIQRKEEQIYGNEFGLETVSFHFKTKTKDNEEEEEEAKE